MDSFAAGMSIQAIAETLNITPETVKKQVICHATAGSRGQRGLLARGASGLLVDGIFPVCLRPWSSSLYPAMTAFVDASRVGPSCWASPTPWACWCMTPAWRRHRDQTADRARAVYVQSCRFPDTSWNLALNSAPVLTFLLLLILNFGQVSRNRSKLMEAQLQTERAQELVHRVEVARMIHDSVTGDLSNIARVSQR